MAIGAEQSVRGSGRVRDVMNEAVLTVAPGDKLRLAQQMMLWGGFRHLPVVDDGDLVGIVSDGDLFEAQARGRASGDTPVREVMTARLETATGDELVSDVAWRMAMAHIQCLPVLERDRLVGILTSSDLLAYMGRGEVGPRGAPLVGDVREVMSRAPVAVHEDTRLGAALGIMCEQGIRHLPVVDADKRLVGLVSDRDLRVAVGDPLEALRRGSATLAHRTVGEVMSHAPTRVGVDATVDALAVALLDERVGAVPVVDDDERLVGIVSYVDVLNYALGREGGGRAGKPD
ncbi:MAG: CBS domain-containing protein [Myxococcales bacterium]|nr:CBS domain-containing protein [Myxococcales bacterium]